ncbi:50S ribosomal protein L25 [Cohnella kolymensis]|uniref:50S ribosomal protein L25 n=1 Tax=Cohnella kolymensis TaxID=1590652 RepID=UPI00069616B7|nr:50S ribosomal protein L25 [Cohnella kolymensis]
MNTAIQFTNRSDLSTSHLNQLRKKGHIPAIVYGAGSDNIPVEVEEKNLLSVLKHNPRAILQATIAGHGTLPVLVHAVQKDMLTGKWIHIDFHQINMNEMIDTKAIIHYSGEPVGTIQGGVLQVEVHEVDIRCMPDKLFAGFTVDIGALAIGDQLLVSDLAMHDGVEILTDSSTLLVKVVNPRVTEEIKEE